MADDDRELRPYGSWPSRLTAADAAAGAVRFGGVQVSAAGPGAPVVRWLEYRPGDGGRGVLCRWDAGSGVVRDEGPEGMSARSGVNEYGGGAWWPGPDDVYWVDSGTQQVLGLGADGRDVHDVTPAVAGSVVRHAAGVVAPHGRWMVCERELHAPPSMAGIDLPGEPVNELAVLFRPDGHRPEPGVTLVRGGDFVAAPTLSPDGTTLAWLRWDHPDMPWDAAELWAAEVDDPDHGPPRLVRPRRVAGGRDDGRAVALGRPVAACLPRFAPDGRLWWCDDASDWWHLYRAPAPGLPAPGAGDRSAPVFAGREEEVGEPRWVAGGSRYGFVADGRVVFAASADGLDSVLVGDPETGAVTDAPGPRATHVEHLVADGHLVAAVAGSPDAPTTVRLVDLAAGTSTDLRGARALLPPEDLSVPVPITFPTAGGESAHGLFYPPRSASARGPDDERPPLVVRIHGGPTAAARAELSPSVQFWTSRGIAVVEVNYRGSTGYGRRYRDLLRGAWGVADVEDCLAAARWLALAGEVDPRRCVIRGGSAGGFTALAALCSEGSEADRVFAAACSLYGVTDLAAMAADTHKFESRYLDGLVGPYPAAAEVYRARSPLAHAHRLQVPVLLLQGSVDPVVPPAQARVLSDALADNGVRHALVVFEGEAHGFRRADTIVRALELELSFYGTVLGFAPDDEVPEVPFR